MMLLDALMCGEVFSSLLAAGEAVVDRGDESEAPGVLWHAILWIVQVGVVTTAGSILLCVARLLRGPELSDRVLAGDVLAFQVVALVILLTVVMEETVFYDTALVVAILGFASTVAFANFIGAPGRKDSELAVEAAGSEALDVDRSGERRGE